MNQGVLNIPESTNSILQTNRKDGINLKKVPICRVIAQCDQ